MHQVKIKNGPSSAKRAPAASKQLQLGAKKSARLDLSKNEEDYFRMPQTCFKENFKNPNEHAN